MCRKHFCSLRNGKHTQVRLSCTIGESETLRPSWMRAIASAMRGATDRTSILGVGFGADSGIEFVTSSRSNFDSASRSYARPDKTGCTTAAETDFAPH